MLRWGQYGPNAPAGRASEKQTKQRIASMAPSIVIEQDAKAGAPLSTQSLALMPSKVASGIACGVIWRIHGVISSAGESQNFHFSAPTPHPARQDAEWLQYFPGCPSVVGF